MPPIKIDQIPRLGDLYRAGELLAPEDKDLPEDWPYTKGDSKLNSKIGLIRADITTLEVDAIVNAANSSLICGGGVDRAIHRAAGPRLSRELRTFNGCDTGDAKISGAYDLPCKRVIHTVGPQYKTWIAQDHLLSSCYERSLEVLVKNGLRSIAFCCIATAIYGYPNEAAAKIALSSVRKFLESPKGEEVDLVVFCLFMQVDIDAYRKAVPRYFPPAEEQEKGESEQEEEDEPEQQENKHEKEGVDVEVEVEPEQEKKPEKEDEKEGADVEAKDEPEQHEKIPKKLDEKERVDAEAKGEPEQHEKKPEKDDEKEWVDVEAEIDTESAKTQK